ncbi:MAG: DUF72 domain-containing protein [Candidatus Margulisiibacteriota bacterium]
MPNFHIGTSGWSYKDWNGRFYPEDIPERDHLPYYQKNYKTVEINSTFYHLPSEKNVVSWYNNTDEEFIFAVKASRYITHVKRLIDCGEPVQNFFTVIDHFQHKCGPILWQLPPNMNKNEVRLKEFIALLPKNFKHAFEFRNPEWFTDSVYEILRKNDCAFVIYDMPGLQTPEIITADFAYVRFHGAENLYNSRYSDEELLKWKAKMRDWQVKDAYIYFNNDSHAWAVENAMFLKEILGDE